MSSLDSPTTPLVTVIVVCHNYGRYLAEAIDSALAQTYSPLQVLVIDDGSTDDSVAVAKRYGDRIKLLTQPNAGLERTVNRAVAEASGELFCFLSADDVFDRTYVATLVSALQKRTYADFAYTRARYFGARTGLTRTVPFSAYLLAGRLNYVNGCALTRRQDYLAVGGYSEDLGDVGFDDWDFWLKMIEAGKRGTYVRQPLLRWRRHDAGSRNPETKERVARSVAAIRTRHAPLRRALSDFRGKLSYALDFILGVSELAVGYSRSETLLRAAERYSWNRFSRRHLPRLHEEQRRPAP
jgi:glycosyltransferase involved in cell wall biosynthesis